ncbi:MAG: response regulator transcription factor [Gammaproteobacteria bacterium]|nr:response regulator transcription factor [Gammaproteobacteria bacterium]
MAESPTVFIVDDDEPVRDSIGMLLDTVGIEHDEFATAQAFLDSFVADRTGCLILDIRMPGMSGLELQDKLAELKANIPIIFITGHGDIPMAVEAMRKGAMDFIRKPFRDQELLDRIQEALHADESLREWESSLRVVRAKFETLSPRETEVFDRVASGQANKVVAIDLGISERTVEIHRSQAMKKMNARTLAALVRMKIMLEGDG